MTTGFVYIAVPPSGTHTGPISKIGFTQNPLNRQRDHALNASAPDPLHMIQCFRFFSKSDAHAVDTTSCNKLKSAGLSYNGRKDFFQVRGPDACDIVRETINELDVEATEGFPTNLDALFSEAGNSPSLPTEYLELISDDVSRAYWHGVSDLLHILSHHPDFRFDQFDALKIQHLLNVNREYNEPTLARTIAGYFRNHSDPGKRKAGEAYEKEIVSWEDDAHGELDEGWVLNDWQKKYCQ